MDAKKTVDFVTGRLAKASTGHGAPGPRRKRGSSYGASRLGIVPENTPDEPEIQTPEEPEAVEVAPVTAAPAPELKPTWAEPPIVESPRVDSPKVETPQIESPKAETPRIDPASLDFLRKKPVSRRSDPTPAATTVSGVTGRLRTLSAEDIRTWGRDLWSGMTSLLSSRRNKDEQDESDAEASKAEKSDATNSQAGDGNF